MSVLAWVWTVSSFWAWVTSGYMVYEAHRDKKVLKASNRNGLRAIVTNGNIRSEILRFVALSAMVLVGVMSILAVRSVWVGTTAFIILNLCIAANTILDRFLRIQLVNHVDRAERRARPRPTP